VSRVIPTPGPVLHCQHIWLCIKLPAEQIFGLGTQFFIPKNLVLFFPAKAGILWYIPQWRQRRDNKMDQTKLSHSVSMSEHTSRFDQNQNDDTSQFKENSPHSGNRLTKSASWFNSLSRRASRKTPIKKRSFAFGSNLENLPAPGVARPRLNK